MSRSALERNAARHLQGTCVESDIAVTFEEADELTDGREVKSNELPVHGNTRTYNLNPLLAQNIINSEYFKYLHGVDGFLEIIDEIYTRCSNVAPWAPGTSRIPSSAFCLLMKLFIMRVTRKQMNILLKHPDSPYIRAIGFLYLRYTCPPKELWGWYEPYLDDEEELSPSPESRSMTIGDFITKLIKEMQFYGTMFPRIPVPIERKMKVQLLLHQEKKKRAAANQSIKDRLKAGVKVRAIYSDERNDPAWYEAVIDSVEYGTDESDVSYWVTFPEYGNSSLVRLGELQLLDIKDESRSRSRDPHRERNRAERKQRDAEREWDKYRSRGTSTDRKKGRYLRRNNSRSKSRSDSRQRFSRLKKSRTYHSKSRSDSRGRSKKYDSLGGLSNSILDNPDALYQQVVDNDRKASIAIGRDYASRPTSYKGSLSLKPDRYTVRRKSSSRSPNYSRNIARNMIRKKSRSPSPVSFHEPKITVESLRKTEALRKKYGDASAKI